jgi:hypothetical protein
MRLKLHKASVSGATGPLRSSEWQEGVLRHLTSNQTTVSDVQRGATGIHPSASFSYPASDSRFSRHGTAVVIQRRSAQSLLPAKRRLNRERGRRNSGSSFSSLGDRHGETGRVSMETDPASRTDPPALHLSARSAERAFQVARLDFPMAHPIARSPRRWRADDEAGVARAGSSHDRALTVEAASGRSLALAADHDEDRSSWRHVMPTDRAPGIEVLGGRI